MSRSDTSGEEVEWELRPGGMLVQKREDGGTSAGGSFVKLKVFHGTYQHQITVPAHSTFGELKRALVQETGLEPHEQRLLFRGKEKDNDEYLHMAGVKNMSRIILMEDPASKERKAEEIKKNRSSSKASEAVAVVSTEVTKLAEKVAALESTVNKGTKVPEKEFVVLTELLMRQLLKLDSIEAEGAAKAQRKIEVRRVQSFVDTLDALKSRNSNPLNACGKATVVTTQWETFSSGMGSLTAPPPKSPTTITNDWEPFD